MAGQDFGAGAPPPGAGQQGGDGGAAERAKATAADARDRTAGAARETVDQAKHQMSRLTDEAQRRARSLVDQQKESAASAVGGWAEALRQTARNLEEREQPAAGRYVDWAADGVERFSRSLREQELDQLVHQAEQFARRQPALFLGGAVALGFVASRFLKSSAERHRMDREARYGGTEYGGEPERRYGQPATSAGGYAPSTGYDPTTGTYGPGSAPARDRYPTSAAAEERRRDAPPAVGGL